jgi:hypothetical protein
MQAEPEDEIMERPRTKRLQGGEAEPFTRPSQKREALPSSRGKPVEVRAEEIIPFDDDLKDF